MNIRPRLLAVSLAVAVVVSLAGGYILSESNNDDEATDVVLVVPGEVPEPVPSLGTIPDFEGDRLPDAVVSDGEGDEISTASFIGEPLVINFWFSTCVPCARELADFAEVDAEVGDSVRFIGMNPRDSVQVMERFAGERGVTYDLFRDDLVDFQTQLEIAFFPYTLFVASDGTIVEQSGVLDADGLRKKVDNLLENET